MTFTLSTGRTVTLAEIMGLRPLDKPRGKFTDRLTLRTSDEVLLLLPEEARKIQGAMLKPSLERVNEPS